MNIIVVGAGWVGEKHIQNLQERGQTITVFEKNASRLKEIAAKYGVCGYCGDDAYQEFILSVKQAQVVFVCVPTYLHIETALIAAKHGCQIFMEKPLSHNLDGVEEFLKIMKEKKIVLYVNYNMKFQPSLRKIRSLLDLGIIGKPVYYHAECGQLMSIGSGAGWLGDKEKGGGVLLETSHEIDYTRWLMGEIKEVSAFVNTISLPIASDDCSDLLLKFESGAQGHIHLDFLQPFYRRKILITGEKGVIEWDYKSHPSWEETYQEVRVRTLERPDHPEEVYTFRKSKSKNDIFKQTLDHFFDCMNKNAIPLTSGENALETMKVVMAAKHSSLHNSISIKVN